MKFTQNRDFVFAWHSWDREIKRRAKCLCEGKLALFSVQRKNLFIHK